MPIAIIRESTGKLVTLVRDDVPNGWRPPAGCIAIPQAELAEGIEREDTHYDSDEERIARVQAETDAIYSQLPLEVQAAFAPVYVAAKDFIVRDKMLVAAALIEAQVVPAELEPFKQAILDKLA